MTCIKVLAVVFILLFTFSCKDDKGLIYPWEDMPIVNYYFTEEITTVEIDKDVTSFKLKGTYPKAENPQDIYDNLVFIRTKNTTARHNVHFVNNLNAEFKRGEGDNVYMEVELIPQNITSEVQIEYIIVEIVSSASPIDPNDGKIRTTIIKLVPKNKE